jgi:hypothetical protein
VRASHQKARRFVEPDVSIPAQPEDHQVDAAGSCDRALITPALRFQVGRYPVEEMNAARRQIDVVEEMALHVRTIAAPVRRRDADELIEVERRHT